MSTATEDATAVSTTPCWFGSDQRALAGWLTTPRSRTCGFGIVLAPPVGPAYWPSHGTYRDLAEALAHAGHTVLRFDYDGTGDSTGSNGDPGRLTAWGSSIREAARELRSLGAPEIVLVGLRLGATLCAREAHEVGATAAVLIAPVRSGSRFAREQMLLGEPVPGPGSGAWVTGGSLLEQETVDALSGIDLRTSEVAPAAHVLIIDMEETQEASALVETFEGLGSAVEYRTLRGLDRVFDVPALAAERGTALVASVTSWLSETLPSPLESTLRGPGGRTSARLAGGIEERFLRLGPDGLVGVVTTPARPPKATVLLLNSGGEPHVGPGRAWVDIARGLARKGYSAVRADYGGWGESPGDTASSLEPYHPKTLADTGAMLRALHAAGHRRVVLLGLCASAWGALHTVLDDVAAKEVAGVVAINPQLYWNHGDPVEPTIGATHLARTREIKRHALGARLQLWTLLDIIGIRHYAASWLRRLARTRVPILLLFAERDDGLVFLEQRTGRALDYARTPGPIEVVEIEGLDHPLHRIWLRDRVVDTIATFLDSRVASV